MPPDADSEATPKNHGSLMQMIESCGPDTPKEQLIAVCNAIAALEDNNQYRKALSALAKATGKSLIELGNLSEPLKQRIIKTARDITAAMIASLEQQIKALDPESLQTHGDVEEWERKIADIPDGRTRGRLIRILADKAGMSADEIRKHVDGVRKEKEKKEAGGGQSPLKETALVKEALPDAPVPDTLRIPEGYGFTEDGKIAIRTKDSHIVINPYPILIAEELVMYLGDTVTTRSKLVFRLPDADEGKPLWAELVADPSTYYDARKILTLTNHRLPIIQASAKNVANWLGSLRNANIGTLPVVHAVPVAGWWWPGAKLQDDPSDGTPETPEMDRMVFLWGQQVIGAEKLSNAAGKDGEAKNSAVRVRLEAPDGDATTLLAAMHSRGTLEGWIQETWHLIKERPIARMRLYASLASPLVRLVGAGGHVNHSSGHTTLGKTVVSQWAMSPWGNPGGPGMPDGPGLMRSWDMTKVGAERTFAFLNDIPAYLDDDPRTKGGQDNAIQQRVQDVVMTLANGIGRVRGSADGKIQITRRWHLIALSTNEQAIRDIVGRDGAAVRTVDLWGSPLVRMDKDGNEVREDEGTLRAVADTLRAATARHYGWAPRYIADVMRHSVEEIRKWFTDARNQMREILKEELGESFGRLESRMVDYFAVMAVAAWIWHTETCAGTSAGGDAEVEMAVWALVQSFRRMILADETAPAHIQAYELVHGWAVANRHMFYGGNDDGDEMEFEEDENKKKLFKPKGPPGGWYGKWEVMVTLPDGQPARCFAVYPHKLQEVLNRAGYPLPTMAKLWRDAGLLVPDSDGKHVKRRVELDDGKSRPRMYVLRHPDAGRDAEQATQGEGGEDRF